MPLILTLAAGIVSSACYKRSPTQPDAVESCSGYSSSGDSQYALPYAVGATFAVSQGNCSPEGNGHRGSERYSYDFDTPIGTGVFAARDGVVEHVETSHFDGQVAASGFDNYIVIRHDDGTRGLYGHLTHDGASVTEGAAVARGVRIGSSGNTGNTANQPHLHFSLHACDPVSGGSIACPTQPAVFRNAQPNSGRLAVGVRYLALSF